MKLEPKIIEKGWGREIVYVSNDKYCGKLLTFDRVGNKFSFHFHALKDEVWYVQQGSFEVEWIDTRDAYIYRTILRPTDIWHNAPLLPHRLTALENNSVIFEVSTHDNPNDNYRVQPGDSQTQKGDKECT